MFSLGILSIIQAFFLPGFIASLLVKDISLFDRLLFAFPLSLVINYVIVFLLVLCEIYSGNFLILISAIEICFILIFFIKSKNSCEWFVNSLSTAPTFSKLSNFKSNEIVIMGIGFLLLGLLITVGSQNIVQGFTAWDAVVSWNHWAVSWANGEIPKYVNTYPQGLPILYSLTYKYIGGTQVQYFAMFIVSVFPIAALVTLARTAFIIDAPLRKAVFLSLPIFIWIQAEVRGLHFLFSGYTEASMAYFGVFSLYAFTVLWNRSKINDYKPFDDRLIGIVLISISGAAQFKQTGFLLACLFPLGYYFYITKGTDLWRSGWFRFCAVIFSVLLIHWYLYQAALIYLGYNNSIVDAYSNLISGHWLMRPINGFVMLFDQIGWPWFLAFFVGLMQPALRRLAIIGIFPIFIFWAFTVSYDLRALFVVFPWISLILAAGCIKLQQYIHSNPNLSVPIKFWFALLFVEAIFKLPSIKYGISSEPFTYLLRSSVVASVLLALWFAYIHIRKTRNGINISILTIVLLVCGLLPFLSSEEITRKLVTRSITQQKNLGVPEMNKYLLGYFSDNPGSVGDLATAWLYIRHVPGLKTHYRWHGCKEDFSKLMNPQVHYILITTFCNDFATYNSDHKINTIAKVVKRSDRFVFYEKVNSIK